MIDPAFFYPILRPFLFRLAPETAHRLTLTILQQTTPLIKCHLPKEPRTVMGLSFTNPIGLAAGLDKEGIAIDALAALGFGFIEIGTVTPRPQLGNPPPRLFRLLQEQAIINRMGFNNQGIDACITHVRNSRFYQERQGVLGINIGKNASTPLSRAHEDYLHCLEKVYPVASYVSINISSPNTPHLRELQGECALDKLLYTLKQKQLSLAHTHQRYVPMAIKIAPDIDSEQCKRIAACLLYHRIDAIIATNTTTQRDMLDQKKSVHAYEAGGLSGAPLRARTDKIIKELYAQLDNALPIIGVGGILTGQDAKAKMTAGAALVQLYSGLIYRGPILIRECITAIK